MDLDPVLGHEGSDRSQLLCVRGDAAGAEREALEFLSPEPGKTAVLAGGTDLIGLMSRLIVQPERVVSLAGIPSLRASAVDASGLIYAADWGRTLTRFSAAGVAQFSATLPTTRRLMP